MFIKDLPKEFTRFINETTKEMEDTGVKVSLPLSEYVELPDGLQCAGFFIDYPELLLKCARGKDAYEWFQVYVHEYCHFTQWRDDIQEWNDLWIDDLYFDEFFCNWMGDSPKEFDKDIINRFLDIGIAIEADCERRVVHLIENENLPLDIPLYARRANSYIHFYNYIRQNRKWYTPGLEPYNIEKVWSQFNPDIDNDFSPSPEYTALYEKYCF